MEVMCDSNIGIDYEATGKSNDLAVKIILLGDSAVGKSKLIERFLLDDYKPHQLSTYALTLFRYKTQIQEKSVSVDFWDTAGQERFESLHPSYYHQANCAILIFDTVRKITYKNLKKWYDELRQYRPEIPCFCAANKIDENFEATHKSFAFPTKHRLPFYYVSASDGTNVVKLFNDAINAAVTYRINPTDLSDQIMDELEALK
ncbi:rab-like protein 2A [Daphnia pulex]|uniref:rab-like protein 2A n=1 Tax=Daphnia pulex TaxID=6669 RepID=UPI001EDD6469|nr:rab-like protein 2A [Daphnia pulex]XP_046657767.1 rab-like protein 2A [Daphnia pulicaria]